MINVHNDSAVHGDCGEHGGIQYHGVSTTYLNATALARSFALWHLANPKLTSGFTLFPGSPIKEKIKSGIRVTLQIMKTHFMVYQSLNEWVKYL